MTPSADGRRRDWRMPVCPGGWPTVNRRPFNTARTETGTHEQIAALPGHAPIGG